MESIDQVGDLGASSEPLLSPSTLTPFGDFKLSRQITGQERPLRQGQMRHLKHPNALLKFDQLFRAMILNPTNKEDMTTWASTKKEEVEPTGHAGSGNIK